MVGRPVARDFALPLLADLLHIRGQPILGVKKRHDGRDERLLLVLGLLLRVWRLILKLLGFKLFLFVLVLIVQVFRFFR